MHSFVKRYRNCGSKQLQSAWFIERFAFGNQHVDLFYKTGSSATSAAKSANQMKETLGPLQTGAR